jgi:hypothetical protein
VRGGEGLTEPLVHGVGVLSPLRELGAESRELLGIGLDVSGIFVEEDLQQSRLGFLLIAILTERGKHTVP